MPLPAAAFPPAGTAGSNSSSCSRLCLGSPVSEDKASPRSLRSPGRKTAQAVSQLCQQGRQLLQLQLQLLIRTPAPDSNSRGQAQPAAAKTQAAPDPADSPFSFQLHPAQAAKKELRAGGPSPAGGRELPAKCCPAGGKALSGCCLCRSRLCLQPHLPRHSTHFQFQLAHK